MSTEMINNILKILAAVVSVLLTYFVVPWFKEKAGSERLFTIRYYTIMAVRSAEQIFKKEEFSEKKRFVFDYIIRKAEALSIDMNEADIDLLIEGVVNEVKHGGNT